MFDFLKMVALTFTKSDSIKKAQNIFLAMAPRNICATLYTNLSSGFRDLVWDGWTNKT
jgi:hypothetical protein